MLVEIIRFVFNAEIRKDPHLKSEWTGAVLDILLGSFVHIYYRVWTQNGTGEERQLAPIGPALNLLKKYTSVVEIGIGDRLIAWWS
uniref:Uncharacterized protein n=1 Tax=Lactuca sativa TaxID=4236 RepID=A0A9R1VAM8_LACSA|nr:hypothetical protein LSAT_V11C500285240 [Lactuca sativa]